MVTTAFLQECFARQGAVVTRLVLSALLAVVLAGCGTGGVIPPLGADQQRQQQTLDRVTFTLDAPRDPLINESQNLQITLTDQRGRPIDGAAIYLDMDMDMLCLSGSKPIADPVGPGRYAATAVYPMAGDWRVRVVATLDGVERRVLFPLAVRDPSGVASPLSR